MKIDLELSQNKRDLLREALSFIFEYTEFGAKGDLIKLRSFLQSSNTTMDLKIFDAVRIHDALEACTLTFLHDSRPRPQLVVIVECRMMFREAINKVSFK